MMDEFVYDVIVIGAGISGKPANILLPFFKLFQIKIKISGIDN